MPIRLLRALNLQCPSATLPGGCSDGCAIPSLMEIDDILAEVDNHSIPQETRDLQELTRSWVNERCAPELLPWPQALMERVLERIEVVEEETGNTDPKSTFRLIVIQTELERFKYLVRSFVRARISKIDKYPLHSLTSPETRARLSSSEVEYATAHTTILHAHYASSFLDQFPTSLQRMDDTAGGINMVEVPDVDKAVFVRGLRDVEEPVIIEGTETYFELKRGDVVVTRWSAVRDLVLAGDAELI